MKINSKILYVFLSYIGIVIIFSVIYRCVFLKDTTSFVLTEQINRHIDRYDFLTDTISVATYHKKAKDNVTMSLDKFCDQIRPYYDKLDSVNKQLILVRSSISKDTTNLRKLLYVLNDSRSDSIEEFRISQLSDLRDSIILQKEIMKNIDTTTLVLSGEFIKLSKLEQKYAEKDLDVSNYILNHYGSFIDVKLNKKFDDLQQKILDEYNKETKYEIERRDISHKIKDSTRFFHNNRLESVTYFDFLYYSFCISTTVSFGDIAPNNPLTRFLASVEIFLCLFLVGILINMIYNIFDKTSLNRKKAKTL